MRKLVVVVLAVLIAGAVGYAFARRGIGGVALLEKPESIAAAWPLQQFRAWSFPLPESPTMKIALRLRQTSVPLTPKDLIPAKPDIRRAMPAADAERAIDSGTLNLGSMRNTPRTGTVSVQLIDLTPLEKPTTRPSSNGSLRILGSVQIGGLTTFLNGSDAVLPDGHITVSSFNTAENWVDGEIYLMTFWLETDDREYRYDVLLDQGPDDPASAGRHP